MLTPKPDAHGARRFSPAPGWFAERARKGEPRNASYFTAAIVLAAMFIINPTFSLLAAGVVTAIYFVLMKRRLAADDSERYASNAPEAGLNIFPLPAELDADFLWKLRDATGSSCLFTQDSGDESALA